MTVLRSLLLVVLRELLVNISYAMLRRCILVMAASGCWACHGIIGVIFIFFVGDVLVS